MITTLSAQPFGRKSNLNVRCALLGHSPESPLITVPIALKIGMPEGIHLAIYFHVSQLRFYCTCTRARVVPRPRERLNRLRSNLVQRWEPVSSVASCKSARTYFARVPVQGDGFRSQERLGRLRSNLGHGRDRDRLVGCRASQLEAHPRKGSASRSLVCRPKRRLTGW